MDYYYEKNPLNFGVSPNEIGHMAEILNFLYNILHINYFHRHSLDFACALDMAHMHSLQYESAT